MKKSAWLLSLLVLFGITAFGELGGPAAAGSEPTALSNLLDQCLAAGRTDNKTEVLSLVAVGLARTGDLDRAAAVLPEITDWRKLGPTQELAAAYARLGRHDQARSVLLEIPENRRPESLVVVATSYAKSGQREQALTLLTELEESEAGGSEWRRAALIYHELGLPDDAHDAMKNSITKGSTFTLSLRAWPETVRTLDAIGERDYARELLDNLQGLARRVEDRDKREDHLEDLAPEYARVGRGKEALRIARSLFSGKSITTRQVGEVLAETGDVEGARQAVAQLELPEYKAQVLAAIARALLKSGDREEALEALAAASSLHEVRVLDSTAYAISLAWTAAGDPARTRESILKIESDTTQLEAMLDAAFEFRALEMEEEELHWLAQAEQLATAKGVWYLAKVVERYGRHGRCGQAVRIAESMPDQCALLLAPVVDHCTATGLADAPK